MFKQFGANLVADEKTEEKKAAKVVKVSAEKNEAEKEHYECLKF